MKRRVIAERKRIFCPGEGQGEQSFIKFIYHYAIQYGLNIHLESANLGGGGYSKMLKKAISSLAIKEGRNSEPAILLVDGDRTKHEDGWSQDDLRKNANENNIDVCFQHPKQEGLYLRMLPGNHGLQPATASIVRDRLKKQWPEYDKPADANTLIKKFTIEDVKRIAKLDSDIKFLLTTIGFKV